MRLPLFHRSSSTNMPFKSVIITLSLLTTAAQAQDRNTEANEAGIKDPQAECSAYYYEPSGSKLSEFPPIWQPATIVSGDTTAQDKWQSISGSVPNINPKGTAMGDFSDIAPTYPHDDPDCWWTMSQCVSPKQSGIPQDIASVPEPKTLGYGFDDGPNCSHNAFYDYLSEQNQKATMFYIGSNVMDWPLEAQRGVVDGHEICVHTWSHRYMTSFSSEDAFAELYYTMKAIKLVTGVTPTCWRPPFGDVDDRIRAIANGLGLSTIIWKYDTFDWEFSTGKITADQIDQNYQSFIDKVGDGTFDQEGAIILTHEINNFTMSEAIKWYSKLQDAFDHIVPVGVALNKTQPYVETEYSLPTFEEYVAGETNSDDSSDTGSDNGNNNDNTSSTGTGTSSGSVHSFGSSSSTASSSSASGSSAAQVNKESSPSGARAVSVISCSSVILSIILMLSSAAYSSL